jgi:hypothetical protein
MRYRYILTTLLLSLFFLSAIGKPVTETEVRIVVNSLLESWNKDLEISKIEARYLEGGELSYYMVDLGLNGWVMVSGDDALRPLLAFSFENSMSPEESWNDAARYLLDRYQEELTIAIRNPELKRDERWDRSALPSATKNVSAEPVDPFIEVTWNQGSGWNMFCPVDEDGPGGRVFVGCVAVAMAQAMSVYEYPSRPKGVKSYVHDDYGSIAVNYDMADPYEWDQMSSTSYDSSNAILLYHLAVSVEMDFQPDGSGAYVRNAGSAMNQYFSYSKNLLFKDRFADVEEWEALLVAELEVGRPIIYRGVNEDGGHAWNIDGYYDMNGQAFFHMNFGWSGSQNAYYTLDNISPGSSAYDEGQGALIGIAPPSSAPYDISLSKLTVAEELPVGSYVADVTVEDEDPNNSYSFTCKGPYNFLLRDYGPASFYIQDGQLFTDTVFEYDETDPEANSKYLLIIVEDQYGNEYQEEFDIAIEKAYYGPEGIALSDTTVMENQPLGTAVAKLIIEDEDVTNSYTYILYGPYNHGTSGFDSASFYVENDTLKTSVVFDREVADTCYMLLELLDSYGNQLSRAFTVQIEPDQSGATGISSIVEESDLLYPNPADRLVTLKNPESISSLEIFEIATGRKISMMRNLSGTVDVSGLPEGIYLVVVHSGKGVFLQKLLIQH